MAELVTAIYDEDGDALFETATVVRLTLAPSNRFAEHTLEDGTVIADHKIVQQKRASLNITLSPDDYKSVYQAIKAADTNNTALTVQTRVDTYSDMYIESYPHEESAAVFDTVALVVGLVELKFATSETTALTTSDVADASDADTTDRGVQQAEDVSGGSTLAEWFGDYVE